ncbi:MAG: hypothetical protein ACXVDA_27100 [Ktedonobacterales bacterium]
MGFTVVYFAGHVLRHIGGILLLCWRRMVMSALIAGGIGLVLAEIIGSGIMHQIPAPVSTQIVATLFAAGLAYGAALTALLAEIIAGALDTIRLLEGEAGAGARAAAIIDERAERELSGFIGWIDAGAVALVTRLSGRRASPRREVSSQTTTNQGHPPAPSQATKPTEPRRGPPAPARTALRPPLELQRPAPDGGKHAQAAKGEIDTLNLETLAEIAATEEFINTAPRPKVNARPVRAEQLPRIEWASEQVERQQEHEDVPATATLVAPLERQISSIKADDDETRPASSPPLPPAEIAPATAESSVLSSPPTPPRVTPPVSGENLPAPSDPITRRQAERLTTPLPSDSSSAQWTLPPPVSVLSPAATTRDPSPRATIPPAETGAERNGIWVRISRALAEPAAHPPASLDQASDDTSISANTPSPDTGSDAWGCPDLVE